MPSAKTLHTIHKWTGLLTGINILVLSVTGAYLVFRGDLNRMFSGASGALVGIVDPSGSTPVQSAFDVLLEQRPGSLPMRVRAIEHWPDHHELVLFAAGTTERFSLDTISGELRTHHDSRVRTVNEFIFKLHATLFLGTTGSFVLGGIALLFLTSTVTGMCIYAPFMKQLAFGAFRRGHSLRRSAADLHKLIGATALGFNLLMAVTGIALTVGLIGVQLWSIATIQSRTAHAVATDAPQPAIDLVLAAANATHPNAPIDNVAFPGGYQGKNYYLVFHKNTGAIAKYIPVLSLIPVADPAAAEPLAMPLWVKAIMICFPLHFGNFAGFGLKMVYSLFGLTSGVLTATGAVLTASRWAGRRKARARKVPSSGAAMPEPAKAES